jgi:phenolic acid decarboxylase
VRAVHDDVGSGRWMRRQTVRTGVLCGGEWKKEWWGRGGYAGSVVVGRVVWE